MGVVWRAEDTRLGRDVAIKVLPEHLAGEPGRLARFEREAKLLAALNHPNVAAIYGLDSECTSTGSVRFLVLELVPGKNLAETLRDGPLPVEEALDLCRQVADGLEAAHAAGVLHRDLKPSNVQVTPDGQAKVLDFGLAKGVGGEPGAQTDLSRSPTVTAGTQAGVVLGTAPYMSPEQARGKTLDRRTDTWSFGCLLYECLTGRMIFRGETVTDILSAILSVDPDMSALPERTPPRVRDLLERCLEKDPRRRLRDAGDVSLELERAVAGREWTTAGVGVAEASSAGRRQPWRVAGLLLGGILIGAVVSSLLLHSIWSGSDSGGRVRHLSIVLPPEIDFRAGQNFGALHGGEGIVFSASLLPEGGGNPVHGTFVRRFDRFDVERIDVPEGGWQINSSLDGRWHAMIVPSSPGSTKRHLVKVLADGSAPPVKIADWPDNTTPWVAWMPGGPIITTTADETPSLLRFPVDRGPPLPPVELQAEGWNHLAVHAALPDGRHALAHATAYTEQNPRIDALLVDVETGEVRLLIEDAFPSFLSPSGHLLFTRGDTLLAVPFDGRRLTTTGGPLAVLGGVAPILQRYGWFSIGNEGTLAYVPGGRGVREQHIAYLDRDGSVTPWSDDARDFESIDVSPDGRRLVASIRNPDSWKTEIWVSEVVRPRLRLLVSAPDLGGCSRPVWSPDGERIAYDCGGEGTTGGLFIRRADGAGEAELLLDRAKGGWVVAWSFTSDGKKLLAHRRTDDGKEELLIPTRTDGSGGNSPQVLLPPESRASMAKLSADGHWIAYGSDESGRFEIYVRTLSDDGELGPRVQVSTEGGNWPTMAKKSDGPSQELFYNEGRQLMVVEITAEPTLSASEPRRLLDLESVREIERTHLPDGRMLIIQGSEERYVRQINVVLNFDKEIERKFAAARR